MTNNINLQKTRVSQFIIVIFNHFNLLFQINEHVLYNIFQLQELSSSLPTTLVDEIHTVSNIKRCNLFRIMFIQLLIYTTNNKSLTNPSIYNIG